ncbi:hypothetical protein TCDM_13129 [Trypanosoma cruzi Dm28c]|uniref:Uncharacterized protein n=1 Tax=Trypanosoma cruzi Dm28c TaxID=1416333 RepID=V5AP36_TRYCR|nr:hypothetical protein TCDM_13129 [Trypanosoma cruzi Dm28c]
MLFFHFFCEREKLLQGNCFLRFNLFLCFVLNFYFLFLQAYCELPHFGLPCLLELWLPSFFSLCLSCTSAAFFFCFFTCVALFFALRVCRHTTARRTCCSAA